MLNVGRLLAATAALPLRAAGAGVSATASVLAASARAAGELAATTAEVGIASVAAPVRGAADLISGAREESPVRIAAEFLGGRPARRCWRGDRRAWIEVRGLDNPRQGPTLATALVAALGAHPHVSAVDVNYPLSRVVVSFHGDAPTARTLCALVTEAENRSRDDADVKSARVRPVDLPADAIVLAGQLVALSVTAAGLGVALAGRAARWPRLPLAVTVPVTIVDYQPRLRRILEKHWGPNNTDTVLAVATAMSHTLAQAPASLAVDLTLQVVRAAEALAAQRAWTERETGLGSHAGCADGRSARPQPPRPGPVERHADRSALAQALGVAVVGAATRDPNAAVTAAAVAAPKASRTAREAFAGTLGRGLAAEQRVLPLRPEALRRLDRVDAVVIDPRALCTDALRVARIRGGTEHDRAHAWQWAHDRLEAGALPAGWHRVGRPGATNGDRRSGVAVLVCAGHQPLASAVVGAARRAGVELVSLDVDDLDDLRPTFDELQPVTDGRLDSALTDAVQRLQRAGRTVAVVSPAAPQALSVADVGVGILRDDAAPPWHAHLLVDDLAGAWRLLHCLPAARAASRRGVELSTAASLLGALLMVPGVRGRGPGPVTAGAAAGLWTGYSLARKVMRAPLPAPASAQDWHNLSPEQVAGMLPMPAVQLPGQPSGSRLYAATKTTGGAALRALASGHRTVAEFTDTLREELSDPLTPILATGSAASAVLGSPIDAVLVGSVLVFNSALAASQQLRAQRLLRRLLAVQVAPARIVSDDAAGARDYTDMAAEALQPGHLIEVRPSEVIPADARLVAAVDLEVDESSLTGESLPVVKQTGATPGAPLAERSCMLFAGTTVMAGVGVAVVTAAGGQTQARRAAEAPRSEGSRVGLQTQLRDLTDRAWPVSAAGGALVGALGLVRGTGLRQAVASGVAVTVAAVPEGLALVATLAQQASARRLSRLGALVRSPRSIEALGRVDVVCFDKTGTLSENRLRVATVYCAAGASREQVLACAARATPPPAEDGGRHVHATDTAVAAAATVIDQPLPEPAVRLPFRSGRPYSAAVVGDELALKGAPEVLLQACGHHDGAVERMVARMAADGLRVIAVARRPLTPRQAESARRDPDALAALCRSDLRVVGLLGLSDTARPDAAPLLASLAAQDIGVRLITGDHPVTAAAIAAELGIPVTPQQVVTGSEWEAMSRRAQERAVTERVVFARMSPENKVQIVQTLEHTGRVCAMVGDGANDAAAIRAATVGIGVAARSSDPARTAADLMLLDGRISSLLDALAEGRKLWQRVQSAVCVLLGGNAGEVAFAVIGSAITGRSPLNTRQLLVINMLTDALPAAALAVSEPNADADSAGRGPDTAALWRTVGVRGATTAAGATLAWVLASLTGRQRRASTVALVALVSTQLFQTLLDSRSRLVVGTAIGSVAVLAVLITTPGVSQLLGNTPLGPLGWAQALGAALAATAAAAAISRFAAGHSEGAADAVESSITSMPARHSSAYNSRNGTASTLAATSVNGSTPTSLFDTVTTVTRN